MQISARARTSWITRSEYTWPVQTRWCVVHRALEELEGTRTRSGRYDSTRALVDDRMERGPSVGKSRSATTTFGRFV